MTRSSFAERYAKVDVSGRFDLGNALDTCNRRLTLIAIAEVVAAKDPACAERLLIAGMDAEPDCGQNMAYTGACARMACVDAERAQRLAERMKNPREKAETLALMAEVLAKTRPSVAGTFLDRAFHILETEGGGEYCGTSREAIAAPVAGAFLAIAEQIDPQRVDEFFCSHQWRVRMPEYELDAGDRGTPKFGSLPSGSGRPASGGGSRPI